MIATIREGGPSGEPMFRLLLERPHPVEPRESILEHGVGQLLETVEIVASPPTIITIHERPDALAHRRHLDRAVWSKNLQEELFSLEIFHEDIDRHTQAA